MLTFLSNIWEAVLVVACWVKRFGYFTLDALVAAVNGLVAALASFVQAVIDATPISMPSVPSLPTVFTTALEWIAWVFPVGTAVSIVAFMVTVALAWWVLSIALRWARAVE